MKQLGNADAVRNKNVDAELELLCIDLMRIRDKASALGLDLLVYLTGMCVDEVRDRIGTNPINFDT